MHVGLSLTFQNLDDRHTDEQIYEHEVAIADRAEPLGFDSIWSSEHHFDGYTMCPNVTQFHNKGLADIKGYEYYGALANNIEKHGIESFVDFLANLQVRGTPDQVFEKLTQYAALPDGEAVVCNFSHGGMPFDESHRNLELFAAEVLPRLNRHVVEKAEHRAPRAQAVAL